MSARKYPAFPIAAVSALVRSPEGIALIKRGYPPLSGYWSLPGGVPESYESLEEALLREVKEEVGIDVEIGRVLSITEYLEIDDEERVKYHYVIITFECKPLSYKLRAGGDAIEAIWLDPVKALGLELTPTTELVLKALLTGRGGYLGMVKVKTGG
ncbi:MAG: hypothetical protein DRN15_02705 [Thermoprotei archaeon]|nr:MAG: hypothetical protein DRN15_02705 [Thermoprotei archaeon]